MKLKSLNFEHNSNLPSEFTCDGANVNPELIIGNVPEDAKSLALIVDDPDAPVGDWAHWLVWNIDPEIKKIERDSVPIGSIQGTTDFGNQKYGGPCPPNGSHRYFFKLFALDGMLDLASSATKKDLLKAIENHVIEKTELIGNYQRV